MGFKRFRVRVEGIDHEVEVEVGDEGAFEALVDGQRHRVVRAPDRGWRVEATGESRTHHTVHLEAGATKRSASVGGQTTTVEVRTAQQAALADALAVSRGGAAGGAVESPMPGRVVRVLVEIGDVVEADQSLIIVEAMKMENEVQAPAAGVVSKIAAQAGQTVEAGQLLIELTPHPDDSA